jgi:hypothetical protein
MATSASASASTSKDAAKKPSAGGGFSLGRAISKCLLFSCGPFYCYPWKPLINEVAGVSYEVANKHFWAQHKDTYNLLWHVVCMFFQVWSNLSFLARIEGPLAAAVGVDLGTKVHGHRMLPLLCVTLWGLVLLIPRKGSDCPFLAKTLSLLTLGLAYNTAHHFTGQVIERICIVAFLFVFGYQVAVRGSKALNLKSGAGGSSKLILILLVLKVALYYGIMNSAYRGVFAHKQEILIKAFVGSLIAMGLFLPDPLVFVVAYGSIAGHILSALVDNSLLFLFCSAFTATLFQGNYLLVIWVSVEIP